MGHKNKQTDKQKTSFVEMVQSDIQTYSWSMAHYIATNYFIICYYVCLINLKLDMQLPIICP